MKKNNLLIFVLLVLCLQACTVRFVPEYSASLEAQIANAAKMNDLLYLDMLAGDPADATYKNYAARYTAIEAEINSIQLRNQQRDKNADMLKIIEILKKNFAKYRDEHRVKANGTISPGEIKGYQTFIAAFWLPLLKAEGGLKSVRKVDSSLVPK